MPSPSVRCVRVSGAGVAARAVRARERVRGGPGSGSAGRWAPGRGSASGGRTARMRGGAGWEPAARRRAAGGGSAVVWPRQEVAHPACSCQRAAAVPGPGQDAVVSTEKREPGRERRLRPRRGGGWGQVQWPGGWRMGLGWGDGECGGWGERSPDTEECRAGALPPVRRNPCPPPTARQLIAVSPLRPSAWALTARPGPWSPLLHPTPGILTSSERGLIFQFNSPYLCSTLSAVARAELRHPITTV